MNKKLLFMLICLMTTVAVKAQFEKEKIFIGASMSGLGMTYNGSEKGTFGIKATGGYFVLDDIMLQGQWEYNKQKDVPAYVSCGVGARYYIIQNGLYLGATANYIHAGDYYDDFRPTVQVGYAYFLSKTVTVEPSIYYSHSFKNHSDYSTIGFSLGVGVYP